MKRKRKIAMLAAIHLVIAAICISAVGAGGKIAFSGLHSLNLGNLHNDSFDQQQENRQVSKLETVKPIDNNSILKAIFFELQNLEMEEL